MCCGVGQVSLPVACQAVCVEQPRTDRQCPTYRMTGPCQGHQYRTQYPIGLLCYQSADFLSTQRIRTHVLHINSKALWPNGLLSGCESESRQASLQSSVQYRVGTALGYREVSCAGALGKWVCQLCALSSHGQTDSVLHVTWHDHVGVTNIEHNTP